MRAARALSIASIAMAVVTGAIISCLPALQDSANRADSLNGELAHCRDVARDAAADHNIEEYKACKAEAGLQ